MKKAVTGQLKHHFRPEFLNRLDEIIVFHSLSKEDIREIVQFRLDGVARAARGQGISLSFTDRLVDQIAEEGYLPEFGARELRRQIRTLVEARLSEEILSGGISSGDTVTANWPDGAKSAHFEVVQPADPQASPAET